MISRLLDYLAILVALILGNLSAVLFGDSLARAPLSPTALTFDIASRTLVVAEKTGSSVVLLDENGRNRKRYSLPGQPSGVVMDGADLLLTVNTEAEGYLLRLQLNNGRIVNRLRVGQGAVSPAVNCATGQAYVCNYFENSVSIVNLKTFEEIRRVAVPRMPAGIAVTPDGRFLFVTNFLPDTRSDLPIVASKVTVIDAHEGVVLKNITLENGSNGLRAIAITPDGSKVYVTHTLGRYQVTATQLERGWIATSALSVIDVASQKLEATVLLDEIDRGAPGSWGVSVSPDSKYIFVAHSGTHDLSIIDREEMHKKIASYSNPLLIGVDLGFLVGIRERIPLEGNGPRAILATGNSVYIGEYFSDSISVITLGATDRIKKNRFALEEESGRSITTEREGEMLFNDASLCYQNWLSCSSCHPDDARGDGLNWDLLNDGLGNPKNTKSLLFSHMTPPTTVTGSRANAEISVRAGFKFEFATVSEGKARAVDAYLRSLKPEPSPYLLNGALSDAAIRGKTLFEDKVKCAKCHDGVYLTDMKMHDLHNAGVKDKTSEWDTPTLREVWRTAPYMHDGRAANLYDVLKRENMGRAAERLTEEEIRDLVEYVKTL